MMRIALIDNYDSFTYNLVHYFKEMEDVHLEIFRNDELTDLYGFDKIVISPGPGIPSENGQILHTIKAFSGIKPILGVCLGLQAIYEAFGGQLSNLRQVHHGVASNVVILDDSDPVLAGLPSPFKAGRYHSWVCNRERLPSALKVTAIDEEQQIMACMHRTHPTFGVQFHPESILTPEGKRMIQNFVEL